MNMQSNAASESVTDRQTMAQTIAAPNQPFLWSVRKELWENRYIYVAPMAAGAVALFGFLVNLFRLPHEVRAAMGLDPAKLHETIIAPYEIAAALILASTLVSAVYYCLESLYGERRDRSILFWKSLPVSDLTTVLSKAAIPYAVLPALGCVIVFFTQLVMLMLESAVLLGSGQSLAMLWGQVAPWQNMLDLLYHMLTAHVLWWAPFYAWFMLVSAWSRRAPFLWAVLPALAVGAVEKITFHTSHFFGWLRYRFEGSSIPDSGMTSNISMLPLPNLFKFLSMPGLWGGLILSAAFLWLAVELRRYRDPI